MAPRSRDRRGVALITADHGNDPTWPGTDHTREHVPILSFGSGMKLGAIGRRESFADIGATILHHLSVADYTNGRSWLPD